MKQLIISFALLFASFPVLAHEDNGHDHEHLPSILGHWKTERPTSLSPSVVAYGEVLLEEDRVVYRSTCSYERGPVVVAEVDAPVEYHHHSFTISETRRAINSQRGYSCEAYIHAGTIHFRLKDQKLVLYSRNTGWRMTLIK